MMIKPNPNHSHHDFHYYDVLAVLIVVLTVIANIVSFKMVEVGPFSIRMGVLVSAIAYIFADIVVEVYGFARMRRIIWMAMGSILLMALIFRWANYLPAAKSWHGAEAMQSVLGRAPRLLITTVFALFAGHMTNAMIMAKMKVLTNGKSYWMRALTSSFVGHGFNAVLYYSFAMTGILPAQEILPAIVSSWFLRLAFEMILVPFSYILLPRLKRAESIDYFDTHTIFTPFAFRIKNNQGDA